MSTASSIEWTDTTWNPVVGCTPVSPGCLNCYAARMARRLEAMGRPEYQARPRSDHRGCVDCGGTGAVERNGIDRVCPSGIRIAEVRNGRAVFTGDVRTVEDRLTEPLHWRKPRRVFVNSMSDLFHEDVPFEFVDRVFAVMALCPQHTFQVLTKRPARMEEYLLSCRSHGGVVFYDPPIDRELMTDAQLDRFAKAFVWPLPNVWLGTSVEDQLRAEVRISYLLRCPAAVRFLSCEPLLGRIDLRRVPNTSPPMPGCPNGAPSRRIDWVIVGGESGPGARPCAVDWVRSIVRQCRGAGVPCFVKQLGARLLIQNDSHSEWPRDGDGLLYDADASGWTYQGELHEARLNDRKGSDPAEWPEDLRVREWPSIANQKQEDAR